MTAMPCGKKKRRREMIQSQTVTPPLAAIEGTTFRLKTATTNRSTRSRRPSARIRWGWAADWVVVDNFFGNASLRWRTATAVATSVAVVHAGADECVRPYVILMGDCDWGGALLLRFRQRGGDVIEGRQVLVNVGLGMLNRDGPLLIPPIGLRHHTAVDHAEPVVTPEIDIDWLPVAIVANFFRIQHQRAVRSGLGDVGLQAHFGDGGTITIRELLSEFVDLCLVLAGQDLAER